MTLSDSPGNIQPGLDLAEARWWIEFIHGDSPGLIHLSGSGDWRGRAFGQHQIDEALEYVQALDQAESTGIYLRACTLRQLPRGGGRGGEQDSWYFPGFWADIDLAGPGHKTTEHLPQTFADAVAIVEESGLPEPSLWVHSGGGLYPWWLLHQPLMLEGATFDQVKEMSQQWQDILAGAAARLGFHYGTGVGDLARVLRLPGTVNRKVPGQPTECRILRQDGRAFQLDDLVSGLTAAKKRMAIKTPEPMEEEQRQYVSFGSPTEGLSPFDHFEMETDWADILVPAGWRESHAFGQTRYWVRPDKNPRDGHSATTGHARDRDRLYVFSTATAFTPGASYTKGAAYAVLNHSGDMKAAARALASRGFGSRGKPVSTMLTNLPPVTVHSVDAERYRMNDTGNAERLVHRVGHKYRFVEKQKLWYMFDGSKWIRDEFGCVRHEMKAVTDDIYAEAEACSDPKLAEKISRFATISGNTPRVNGAVSAFQHQPGMSVSPGSFDKDSNLLNVLNGTLDLTTFELREHRSTDFLSKQVHANYRSDAVAPQWLKFLEEAIPDPESREYLQRALGYSLLGEADQRKLFLLWGPSGTGKSQLIRLMQLLFGDYGGSAAPSTFKVRKGEVISNDVHDLRGKRFVATSETSADTLLDEELVKRFTGNDLITSRGLYQENQSWRPNCVIWMATNHLPNLNSDDDAIWHRIRTIHMGTVFAGRKDEVGAFAEKVLMLEADGILNWLLEGVRMYRAQGLGNEPQQMLRTLESYKVDTDTVAQFLEDALDDEIIAKENLTDETSGSFKPIEAMRLYALYADWSHRNGTAKLGSRRFGLRMRRLGYESYRSNGIRWKGIRIGNRGATGQMPLGYMRT